MGHTRCTRYTRVGQLLVTATPCTPRPPPLLLPPRPQGAEIVKRSSLNARFLFIAPPCFDELERRLRGRGTESEDKIQVRGEGGRRGWEWDASHAAARLMRAT